MAKVSEWQPDDVARIEIDDELCMNSGQCAYMHPELFKIEGAGVPTVLVAELTDAQLPAAQEAIDTCPSQAISLAD